MKPGQFLLLIIVLVVSVISISHFIAPYEPQPSATAATASGAVETVVQPMIDLVDRKTAFERVLKTGVLRCGYYVYPPVTYRDLNTGELSGFSVDMMQAIAAATDLKIEWAEEVSFGSWPQALQSGRIDAACTPMWPSMMVARAALIGEPLLYSKVHAVGRAGETRFKSLADVNKPGVRVSVFEGNDTYLLAKQVLPQATLVTVPAAGDTTQPIMDVLTGKADVFISDMNAVKQWNEKNKDKIAVTAGGEVIKMQSFVLAVAQGEHDLMAFLNNAVRELQATNSIERMMRRWQKYDGIYYYPQPSLQD